MVSLTVSAFCNNRLIPEFTYLSVATRNVEEEVAAGTAREDFNDWGGVRERDR